MQKMDDKMKRFKVKLRRFLTLCERKNNERHSQATWQTGSPNFTPPDDNHSHLTIHRSGSLKRLFAPLCIALMGVFFVSYAQAAKVCHTKYFQPTICSKPSNSKKLSLATTRDTLMCRKARTPVRMEFCHDVLEYGWWNIVFPESEHNLQDFLEHRKGQVLRDEIITVEPSVFDALKNNRDFLDIQIKGSELEQSIHFDKSGRIVDTNSNERMQSVHLGELGGSRLERNPSNQGLRETVSGNLGNKLDTHELGRMQDLQQGIQKDRLKQETIKK